MNMNKKKEKSLPYITVQSKENCLLRSKTFNEIVFGLQKYINIYNNEVEHIDMDRTEMHMEVKIV